MARIELVPMINLMIYLTHSNLSRCLATGLATATTGLAAFITTHGRDMVSRAGVQDVTVTEAKKDIESNPASYL